MLFKESLLIIDRPNVATGLSDFRSCHFLFPLTLLNRFDAPLLTEGEEVSVGSFGFCAHRQWHNEQETDLGQRAGPAGPPGLAVQEEGQQRLLGYQVEEILVRAEEDVALLVHQSARE